MGGVAFSLLAAFFFASYLVLFRRVVVRTGEYTTAMLLMLPVGILYYLALMPAFGGFAPFASIGPGVAALFALAGIINMIGGRGLNFHSIRLLGGNRAAPLTNTSPLYAGVLGILLLDEPFSVPLVLGIVFIVAGATLISQTGSSNPGSMVATGYAGDSGLRLEAVVGRSEGGNPASVAAKVSFWEGILAGLGAGLCFAIGAVLVRYLLHEKFNHPLQGNIISYAAALATLAWMPFAREHRARLARLKRGDLALILVGGLIVSSAGFSQYLALNVAGAGLVSSIQATYALFLLFLSWFLNRRLEVFSMEVVLGITATVLGTVLVSL